MFFRLDWGCPTALEPFGGVLGGIEVPSYEDRSLGEDIEELKKRIKRLNELADKAVAYEFGEGGHRVRAAKEGKVWRVRDVYGNALTRTGKFTPAQVGNSNIDWGKDEAIKEAEKRAKL